MWLPVEVGEDVRVIVTTQTWQFRRALRAEIDAALEKEINEVPRVDWRDPRRSPPQYLCWPQRLVRTTPGRLSTSRVAT